MILNRRWVWLTSILFSAATACCVNLINEQRKEITCFSAKSLTAADGGVFDGKFQGKGKCLAVRP